MQYPDESSYCENDADNCYGWLIQFSDGSRLDLHVCTLEYSLKEIRSDRLCRILLDKDNCLPGISISTDKDHWVRKPMEHNFLDTYNEFWWCLNNVAKGLWRKEILYVMDRLTIASAHS